MKSSVFCPLGREAVVGFAQHLAQFLHAAGHGAELLEMAAALLGQQPGQGGLAGARRAVEDHRAQAVGLQQPAEQLPLAEKMLLADELGQRHGPHPRGQRLRPLPVAFLAGIEERHEVDLRTYVRHSRLPSGPPGGNNSRSGHAAHFGPVLRQ